MSHEVQLVKGDNPVVLAQFGIQRGDPSGFEGWSEREVDTLLTIVRQELDRVVKSTSVDISSMLPKEILIYIKPRRVQPTHASPNAVQPVEIKTIHDADGQERRFMTKKSLAHPLGIALGFERGDLMKMNAEEREDIRHELVHTTTRNAIEIYEALTEGVVEYLSQDPRDTTMKGWRRFPWDAKHFQGTTGLRTPNFTMLHLEETPGVPGYLYQLSRIIALSAFQRQTHDQIWSICKTLHERAINKGTYPTYDDFCDVACQTLPRADVNGFLGQLLFQEMSPGDHGYLLPLKESYRSVLAQSVRVQRNSEYGIVNPHTGVPNYRPYILSNIPSMINYKVMTSSGAGGGMTVLHKLASTITPDTVANTLQAKGISVQPQAITSLTCSLRGLRADV